MSSTGADVELGDASAPPAEAAPPPPVERKEYKCRTVECSCTCWKVPCFWPILLLSVWKKPGLYKDKYKHSCGGWVMGTNTYSTSFVVWHTLLFALDVADVITDWLFWDEMRQLVDDCGADLAGERDAALVINCIGLFAFLDALYISWKSTTDHYVRGGWTTKMRNRGFYFPIFGIFWRRETKEDLKEKAFGGWKTTIFLVLEDLPQLFLLASFASKEGLSNSVAVASYFLSILGVVKKILEWAMARLGTNNVFLVIWLSLKAWVARIRKYKNEVDGGGKAFFLFMIVPVVGLIVFLVISPPLIDYFSGNTSSSCDA